MAWYRFHCTYGPGHQGISEEYHWSAKAWGKKSQQTYWEEIFDDRDYPIGGVDGPFDTLPEDVKKRKVQEYRSQMHYAMNMLKILGEE